MSWFIAWFVLSIAVAVFADNRGRSGGGWFLLSLIISPPLGLIFLAISKDLRKEREAETNTIGPATHAKCQHCAEWVLPEAVKCKHCGEPLKPDPEFAQRAAAQRKGSQDIDIRTRRIYIGAIIGIGTLVYLIKNLVNIVS